MKPAKSTQFHTLVANWLHLGKLSERAAGTLQRMIRRFLSGGLCILALAQVVLGQYTPWDPVVPGNYSIPELVSVGANGLMTVTVSCIDSQFRISILIASSTPQDSTATEETLPVLIRWDNETPVKYIFSRQSDNQRSLFLNSDVSSSAAPFVARWLLHGRMRVRLPASSIYPLPVFESWSLTGTSAEWNALGCEHPNPDFD